MLRAPLTKHRTDSVATRVFGDQLRTCKVRSGLSPRGITPVAKAALGSKPQFTGLNLLHRIRLWRRRSRPWLRSRALNGISGGTLRKDDTDAHKSDRQSPNGWFHPQSNTDEIRS